MRPGVAGVFEEADEVRPAGRGERRLGGQVGRRTAPEAAHQPVAAEVLAAEEHRGTEAARGVEVPVERRVEEVEVHAEVVQQRPGGGAEGRRRVQRLRAAVAQDRPPAEGELVALGVAAEVVVVVEDQDAGVRPGRLPVEVGRGESADAAADHHQVELAPVRRAGVVPGPSLPDDAGQPVGDLERPRVAPAKTGERRRVGRGRLFRAEQPRRERRKRREAGDSDGDPVQEVPAGDAPAHTQGGVFVSSRRGRGRRGRFPASRPSGGALGPFHAVSCGRNRSPRPGPANAAARAGFH